MLTLVVYHKNLKHTFLSAFHKPPLSAASTTTTQPQKTLMRCLGFSLNRHVLITNSVQILTKYCIYCITLQDKYMTIINIIMYMKEIKKNSKCFLSVYETEWNRQEAQALEHINEFTVFKEASNGCCCFGSDYSFIHTYIQTVIHHSSERH